jgi:hypothetical protein
MPPCIEIEYATGTSAFCAALALQLVGYNYNVSVSPRASQPQHKGMSAMRSAARTNAARSQAGEHTRPRGASTNPQAK